MKIKWIGILFLLIACFLVLVKLTTNFSKPNSTEITQVFNSYVLKTQATQKLVIHELHTVEKIERSEKLNFLWNLFSFKDINTEMFVPVSYAFFIDLKEGFQIEIVNGKYVVQAPELKSMTPAADISAISFKASGNPFFYDVRRVEDDFRNKLTQYLNQQSEFWLNNYKPEAAKSLKRSIKLWLAESSRLKDIPDDDIEIHFRIKNESQVKENIKIN